MCLGLTLPLVRTSIEGLMDWLARAARLAFCCRPDLVMVIGTSLQVAPISLIPSIFRELPRVLINRCVCVRVRACA